MDIFDGPYYRMNKLLLTCLGQWPYQDPLHKRLIRITIVCFVASILVVEICQLLHVWGDLDYVIESFSTLGVQTSTSLKFSNYIWNADKIKVLMDRIHHDWNGNIGPQMEIIRINADKGRKLTQIYSGVTFFTRRTKVYMYSTLAMYLTLPMVPKFLDVLMPLNETRTVMFPLPIRYFDLDPNTYYLPMMLHTDVIAILTITTVVAMDSTYAMYVQHACGLFAAVGDKLERLTGQDVTEEQANPNAEQQEEITYKEIVSCVKMHSDAIEFADVIESSQTVLYFFVIGLTVFCMSIAGYQTVMNLERPGEAFRCAAFSIAQVAHIFFNSLPGQKLIDHSERIHEWVFGSRWYDVSARSKKLLLLMMLRSETPCKLTAGKLYVMSLANFSMIVRTSVSYFTVLTSFR